MKKVAIGGTFGIIHKGHKVLLRKAFELGEVTIGLTSDREAQRVRKREVRRFKERKKELEDFLSKELRGKYKILKIEDKFGPTLKEDFDYIVVSPDTYKTALLINRERKKSNKKPIKIVEIDFVLAEDGKPISAGRILKGEINEENKAIS